MGKQRKDKMFPDIVIMRMRDKIIKKKGNVVKPVFLIELKEHSKYVSSSVKSTLKILFGIGMILLKSKTLKTDIVPLGRIHRNGKFCHSGFG